MEYLDRATMWKFLAIAVGGACGAVCRFSISVACRRWIGDHFAFGTLTANVIGCFLLGLLVPLGEAATPRWSEATYFAMTVGFIGALTTLSTFGLETFQLVEDSKYHLAASNVALNVVIGLVAVAAGLSLGRHFAS